MEKHGKTNTGQINLSLKKIIKQMQRIGCY